MDQHQNGFNDRADFQTTPREQPEHAYEGNLSKKFYPISVSPDKEKHRKINISKNMNEVFSAPG
jgi:hypothetical protein